MNPQHDETSVALIKAAHAILESSGPEALTVRRIAAEAGMSTMNVYSRFDGKTGVIDELYADGYRRLAAALQAVPTTSSIPRDVVLVLHTYRQFAIDNRTYYRIMFRTSAVNGFVPSPDSTTIAFTCLSSLCVRVELAQARGDFATYSDWAAEEIAAWLWATAHGLVSLEMYDEANQTVSWRRIYERGIETAVRGLFPVADAIRN
ncbi:MAG TPA: TetR/AcrR family transcriptional regulator [Ilumatobacter sp.]|nr:TetR/AcrR family transcriptional regulator [Ilumatobacter sp.]